MFSSNYVALIQDAAKSTGEYIRQISRHTHVWPWAQAGKRRWMNEDVQMSNYALYSDQEFLLIYLIGLVWHKMLRNMEKTRINSTSRSHPSFFSAPDSWYFWRLLLGHQWHQPGPWHSTHAGGKEVLNGKDVRRSMQQSDCRKTDTLLHTKCFECKADKLEWWDTTDVSMQARFRDNGCARMKKWKEEA